MDQKNIFDRRSAVAARGLLKSNLANFGLPGSPGALRRPKSLKNYKKRLKMIENGRKSLKVIKI